MSAPVVFPFPTLAEVPEIAAVIAERDTPRPIPLTYRLLRPVVRRLFRGL